ncbi:MAG TPA: hypothetical protein VFW12_06590 [Candidatus Limnocylindria bacterium]|nr:hypothetical protein [Candidatus Limnocylindria bacterium]
MKTGRALLFMSAIAAVIALALIAGFGLRDHTEVAAPPSSPSPTASVTPAPTPTATASTASPARTATQAPTAAQTGTITGFLGYPSNFIPPLTVYAVSVADPRVHFSVDTSRYGGDPSAPPPSAAPGATAPPRPSYTMTGVPPGTYYVLAWRNDDVNVEAKNAPGVYSKYVVECIQPGERAQATGSCPDDHSLLPVTVRAGETVMRIDVTDWYYQQGTTYPSRPR